MYNFFSWIFFISGIVFSIASIVFVIANKAPRLKLWRVVIIGLWVLMLCGLVGMALAI